MSGDYNSFPALPQDGKDYIQNELLKKIVLGDSLRESLNEVCHIKGVLKLQRRINQELAFLRRVLEQGKVQEVHVKCSNLSHLEAHVNYILKHHDSCSSILEKFQVNTPDGAQRLCVDIIKDGGNIWVKVIARNARALSVSSNGDGEYGQRSVIDQAKEFLLCAQQHPHNFKLPKIIFVFTGGIEVPLAVTLEQLGIHVHGERIMHHDSFDLKANNSDCHDLSVPLKVKKLATPDPSVINFSEDASLNLDITAMVAYVSALTNGGANASFNEDLLNQQAQWERERPVKLVLDKLFAGKILNCCQTAYDDFRKIINTLGGSLEVKRADSFLKRINVVADQMSERTNAYLKIGGKIKARSRIIFGTGDQIKAVTVTANQGFIRSAKSQGLDYSVVFHESRALTERKALEA